MKTKFSSKLFKKQINSQESPNISGGRENNYSTSGGTESGPTTCDGKNCDIYTNFYNDDCEFSYNEIC